VSDSRVIGIPARSLKVACTPSLPSSQSSQNAILFCVKEPAYRLPKPLVKIELRPPRKLDSEIQVRVAGHPHSGRFGQSDIYHGIHELRSRGAAHAKTRRVERRLYIPQRLLAVPLHNPSWKIEPPAAMVNPNLVKGGWRRFERFMPLVARQRHARRSRILQRRSGAGAPNPSFL
jgi:hypothetical protein